MPVPTTFPLPRTLAREDVYTRLQSWIVDGTLRAGEVLRDLDLAAQLGVSPTPVREALRRLEDEGLIETARNRWTRVAPLDLAQARDLCSVVAALDALTPKRAWPALDSVDHASLKRTNDALRAAIQAHAVQAARQADEQFHAVWLRRSGNREVAALLGALSPRLHRLELAYFNVAPALASPVEHDRIIRALERGDQTGALAALDINGQHTRAHLG